MIDKAKLAELLSGHQGCIEFSDDTLKTFQELEKEFGYCNLAKAIKSANVKCIFTPDSDFFRELRKSLERLQADEVPTFNFVCNVTGDNYSYDIFTNYLCSDAFIKLSDLHFALNNELATSKIFRPIEWENFHLLCGRKFIAYLGSKTKPAFLFHTTDAKDFLDSYLPACFDREKILPQIIIDTCNSPFPRPAIQISKLKTLWVIPDNEPQKMIDICVADNKIVVCLNQINAYLAKVNPAPFNRNLVKAAIKKKLYKFSSYYYCELEDLDDILADVSDDAAQLRRIFSAIETDTATTTKRTINLEE